MEIKKIDSYGWGALIFEEGLTLKPYRDSKGIPTIGIGMTYYPETGKRVTLKDPALSGRDEAIRQCKLIVKPFEKTVWSSTRDDITQSQFNALFLICYNIGQSNFKASTLLKRVNNNPLDFQRISEAFEMWRYADGEPILLPRRKREFKIYSTGSL